MVQQLYAIQRFNEFAVGRQVSQMIRLTSHFYSAGMLCYG